MMLLTSGGFILIVKALQMIVDHVLSAGRCLPRKVMMPVWVIFLGLNGLVAVMGLGGHT